MSCAKNTGKNLSTKYGQKHLDGAKKSATYAIKAGSKSEVTSELIDNRIVDKITSVSKFSTKYSMKLY